MKFEDKREGKLVHFELDQLLIGSVYQVYVRGEDVQEYILVLTSDNGDRKYVDIVQSHVFSHEIVSQWANTTFVAVNAKFVVED